MAIGGNNQTLSVTIGANMDPSGVLSAVKQMQSAFSGLKLPGDIGADLEKSFGKATDLLKKYQTQLSKGINTKTDAKNITKTGSQINEVLDEIVTHINSINGQQIFLKADVSGLNTLKTNIEDARTAWKNAIQEFRKGSDIEKVLNEIAEKTTRSNLTQGSISSAKTLFDKGDLEGYRNALDDIYNRLKNLKDTTIKNVVENLGLQDAGSKVANLDQIKKRLEDISKIDFSGDSNVDTKFKAITTAVTEYETEVKRASQAGQNAFNNINVNKTVKDTRDLVDATDQYKNSVMSAKDQVQQLQQSTQYFFSLRNMINLLKRGIREAVDTVKDLDKAMTETAVVTNYSVGDMWAKLPEYTANANKLGATIQDMYESTTLYYQQGLNTEQAMSIAAETMKMARIAGLEAKDATDMMTAALRGFNMEINEMSAERINDVYSNLAAKTASNTEELGTAMQRTASIAHSAGMSFEGTAAFLAQAIETTREPAENLGTAMKTIVARFQELKKNPLEITEVDGEEVSYNKVDTALQSIGVSLKDANGQFRDLDKVFLDISKRWDSLTQTQQRYIATTAAGSRQQSRFIAMMSNYDRTMELMGYANDSAGASTEQFNKTLDSLEAKINKFQNAWKEFLMNIMNDSWTKKLVDGGTKVLSIINDLIDKLSFGNKGLKSILSIFTAFTALKAGGNIVNKLIGGLGGLVDPTSTFGKGFWGAGRTTTGDGQATGLAGKITTPIVAKLSELIAVTKGQKFTEQGKLQTTSTVDQYKATTQALRKINGMDMGTIGALFGGLSDEHAYAAYKNTPGTADAIKQAALGWFGSKKMPADAQKTGQQLMNGIFKGMDKKEISIKDGMKLIGQPQKWGEQFGTDVAWNFSNSFSKELTNQAHANTLYNLGLDPKEYAVGSSAFKKLLSENKVLQEEYVRNFKDWRGTLEQEGVASFGNMPVVQTGFQQFANKVGLVGSAFSTAGMSLQMFGSQLSQLSPALQGVGSVITQIGMAISTFGMGISSVGKYVVKAVGRISLAATAARSAVGLTAGSKAGLFASILTEGLSAGAIGGIAGAAIVGGILIAKNIAEKRARAAGEEVRTSFENGFTKTNEKLDSLEGYKDAFNELSKGVDEFGHNIDLTDEEYDEYLSISRELSEISPSLIAGYNAEGQAILRKGEALDEVINKLKEEKKLALENYITNDSIDKLIGEYNTSDAYKKHHTTTIDTSSQSKTIGAFDSEKSNISKAIKQANLEWSDFSQILEELGAGSAQSIDELTASQLGFITSHYGDVLNKIKEVNPQLKEEAEEGLKEAFGGASNAIEDILTEGKPITDALKQWMGQENLDAIGLELGNEFVAGFNNGLEGLMLEGLTNNWQPEQYKQEIKAYSDEWKLLAGSTSEYADILSEADDIQQEYLDHIGEEDAVEDYKENIEQLAVNLEDLAEKYRGTGQAGEVFAEQCIQQANALRNYATEGAVSLGEALNVLSGKFAEARGAKERFDKAIEGGDYYTAAEGFRSIAETVLDEKNSAGDGSLTAWAGAEALLGQKFVDSAKDWKDVQAQVEKVNKLFDDGIEGVYNFNDMLVEAANSGKDLSGIGEVVGEQFHFKFDNLDNLKECADILGMSEDVLAGMIDKARQFAAFNVGNNKQIRQALEQSQQSMIGQSYGSNGKSNLYMSEAVFREEAYRQGIRGNDYTKTKEDLDKEQNVKFLTVESLKANKGALGLDNVLKDVGLEGTEKTLDNTVAVLTKMGFDLADQKEILSSKGIKLADGAVTDEQIEAAYKEQQFAVENPTVSGIANDTGVIASAATAILASMGIMTNQMKQDIRDATSNSTIQGYKDSLNQNFTDSKTRNAARAGVEQQIADYEATMRLLEEGGLKNTAEYQALASSVKDLKGALDEETQAWNESTKASQESVKNMGANQTDQFWLNQNAVDVENMLDTTSLTEGAKALEKIKQEGNLSAETVDNLTNKFLALHATELLNMDDAEFARTMNKFGIYGNEIDAIHRALNQPFVIQTKLTGEDLKEYISSIDGLTNEPVKSIILKSYVKDSDKVTDLFNTINKEFGDGSEETKSIIIQATAKLASGDTEGAHELIQEQFGKKTEEVETALNVICDGSIANPDAVKNAIESELKTMTVSADVQANIKADTSKINLKQTGSVNYTTKVDEGAIKTARQHAQEKVTMPVDANTDAADKKINKLKNPGSATIDVYMRKAGSWTATVAVTERARGQNYSIPAHHTISFGSAADGLNLPKKKRSSAPQMTALVGEEGFEIGYIPSEQRSVIFGANGPEMTSFPSDTIIYPHQQSKDILRRGKGSHKTAGSFVDGLLPSRSTNNGGSPTYTKILTDTAKRTGDNLSKKAENTSKAIARVTVWWENAARRAEAIQRKMDKNQNDYEKYLKDATATLKTTGLDNGGKGNQFIANSQQYIAEQKLQYNKAKNELTQLNSGKWQSGKKKGKKATSKANKKKNKKKNQIAYEKGADNILQVSYEGKNSKGKKVTKTSYVNTASYIKWDKASGSYQIDQKKLKSIKNKDKRKQVADQLNKELNDRISKKNAAEDNIRKAQEALEKFSEELYENFFSWEIELTKIQNLTQQIDALTSKIGRKDSMENLINAQIKAGALSDSEAKNQTLQNFNNRLQLQQDTIAKRREAIDQSKRDLSDKATGKNIQSEINAIKANLANTTNETKKAGYQKALEELQEKQAIVNKAQEKYVKYKQNNDGTYSVDFDTAQFEKDKALGLISKEMAEGVQNFAKELEEGSQALDDLYREQTEGLTAFYDTLNELDEQWASYEQQLIEINEEANKKELEQVKKLSDSIKKAMDDLLSEVKRRLDERRKIEENQKTEQDISRKQQRLAALRADTSGGHQVEIAQLEKEIADAQNSYQQSLEDQLLDRLQVQADEAAQQRERQIALQEELASGVNNILEVQKWMAAPEDYKKEILEQYRKQNKYYDAETGEAGKAKIDSEFATFFTGLMTNKEQREATFKAIEANKAEEKKVKQAENVTPSPSKPTPSTPSTSTTPLTSTIDVGTYDIVSKTPKQLYDDFIKSGHKSITGTQLNWMFGNGNLIGKDRKQVILDLVNTKELTWEEVIQAAKDIKMTTNELLDIRNQLKTNQTKANMGVAVNKVYKLTGKKKWKTDPKKFATGGLADYTGPAWLDGTPSKPELVLNAQDTQNFITLRDVLSKALGSTSSVSNEYGGDILYEININVDKIEKDYDVDRVVEKVKKEIIKGAGYRNVTQVRNFR